MLKNIASILLILLLGACASGGGSSAVVAIDQSYTPPPTTTLPSAVCSREPRMAGWRSSNRTCLQLSLLLPHH